LKVGAQKEEKHIGEKGDTGEWWRHCV